MLIAPIIGSVMYTYFGFEMTFWILGGIDYLIAACIIFVIPKDVDIKDTFVNTSSFVKNDPAQIHLRSEGSKYEIEYKRENENSGQVSDQIEIEPESKSNSLLSKGTLIKSNKKYKSVSYCQLLSRKIFLITSIAAFFSYFSYWSVFTILILY